MVLLDATDITAICNRAIAASLALPPRDALFLGINPAARAAIFSNAPNPADALRIEVDNLNNFIDPTGFDGYLLAIWLTNAADKLQPTRGSDAAYFRDMAAKVAAIPAPPPATKTTVTDIISVVQATGQTNQKLFQAAQSLRAAMPGMNKRATNLMVAKRLHDALHNIQLYIIPLWTKAVAALAVAPAFALQTVADRQRELGDKSKALLGEFGFLPAGDSLRSMAQKTADDLVAAARDADAALAKNDADGLKSAIAMVRGIVKEGMQVYAGRMDAYQEALDLSDILADLANLGSASADPALQANTTRLASSLAAILQDLNVLGPQHSQWQMLDVRLGTLENLFDFLHLGPSVYSSFNLEWGTVNVTIESLSSQPPTDRFERVKALRDGFLAGCPVPVKIAPNDQAIRQFGDFVIEVRSVFHEVDLRMKEICNQLREITNQLARL